MGSKSSSDSRQATTNNSTSLGVQGDNTGYMTVGNGNTYNIQQTDHGLVDGVVDIWGDMSNNINTAFNAANDMNYQNNIMTENVTTGAFDYARDVNSDSLDFANSSLGEAFDFGRDSLDFAERSQQGVFDAVNSAFGFGSDALDANTNLARDSIDAQNYLAETSIDANSSLARDVASLSESMHATNTAFANNAMLNTIDAIGDSNERVSELAYFTANNSSDLARDFATGTASAYADAAKSSLLASEQALQFVDDMSRSDDSQLAKDTNKTMIYVVVGMAGVVALALTVGRK
ncbi:hypothetical protein NDQ71_02845 [Pseudoalteromonas sp. KG3]|uniref:hypothetical protein n=1 Tax=Pseudoalteromonas sp. KG3 TaxID=2951137 RepID=UPI00265838A3|nr:hypothetical protein [Pseudoalteromonas sp. KG3]WKD24048.1 hypothetical protein NDQ71_02845 [Pseudoalteromonas sp. KG3]